MVIPDKAVEAARNACFIAGDISEYAEFGPDEVLNQQWRARLEAAAPFITAQALSDYEDSIERWIHMEGPIESADVLEDVRNTYGPR